MKWQIADLLVCRSVTLRAALEVLNRLGSGFVFAVDDEGKLAGVLTDGDIRRALLRDLCLDDRVEQAMQADCVKLPVESSAAEISGALTDVISFVPLVDRENRPVDYASRARQRRYPVMEPLLDGNEAAYVQECVRSGWVSSQGRFVTLFERMMAEFHGVPHALAVTNGTAALHLALASLGVGRGDEVIVPDFSFAATANTVLHAGARPVFIDVDSETWTIDLDAVERALTPRTRAIVPVHIYGHPCEMERLMALASQEKLVVVEDAAEALGARFKDRRVGTFGDAGCYSFFGNKTLTTGEGGIVLFRDSAVWERARTLRDHGMSRQRRYWHVEVGYNYRLTNLQAAVGVAQMERVESILARKRNVANRYDAALSVVPGIKLPPRARWAEPIPWLYTILVSDDCGITRDELASRLLLKGIETRPTFCPLHLMPPFREFGGFGDFPVTALISRTGLSLPSAATLCEEDIDSVVADIGAILRDHNVGVSSRAASGAAWPPHTQR